MAAAVGLGGDWEGGSVGAWGAGMAGSEIQPYLEGGIEEAAYRVTLWAGWCAVGTVPSPGVC